MKNKSQYCNQMPFFPTKEQWLDAEYKKGNIIKKEDLIDQEIYLGECRNADMALWIKKIGRFVYIREKFGTKFLEEIEHPADECGYDVFIPHILLRDVENSNFGFVYYFNDTIKDFEKFWNWLLPRQKLKKENLLKEKDKYMEELRILKKILD